MGQFLAKPVTETFPEDHSNGKYAFGSSSMQGYRTSQEDAHTCLLDFDEGVLLAAVYDGHGGAEVAQYAAKKFPEFLKNNASYKNQQYERALVEAFLEFDASLIREDVLKELKALAGDDISEAENEEDMHANLSELKEEARMPIEQLLERFARDSKKERQSKLKAQKSIEESISSNKTDQCSSTSKTDDSSMEPCSSSSKLVENGESSTNKSPEEETSYSSKNNSAEVTSTGAEVEASDEAGCSSSSAVDSKPDKEDESSENQPSSSNSTEETADKSTASDPSNEPSSTGQEKSKRIKPIKVSSQCSKSTFLQMLDEIDEEDDEEDESDEGIEEDSEEFYDSSSDDDSEGDESDDDLDEEEEEENEEDEGGADKAAINGDAEDQRQHPLRRFMFDEGPGKDSGCTAVIALIKDNKLYVANAGDSRCVLSRAGQAIEMSHDHKPTNEIEFKRIKRAGGRVTNDGRVNGGLNLSRAFGDHSYKVNKDLPLEEQMITALPDIKVIEITDEDDFIVLACDGIWNSMSSREVVEYINDEMRKEKKLSKICDSLFFKCLAEDAHNSDGSGCDNQTAIIIKLKDLPTNKDNGELANAASEVAAKSESNETKIVAELSEESNGKRKRGDDEEFTNGTEQSIKTDSPTSKKAKSELVE